MSKYVLQVREHVDLGLRVNMERLMASNLEVALFDISLNYDILDPILVQSYHKLNLGQEATLIEPMAALVARLARYHHAMDEARALDLHPTGVLLTRLRRVKDACEMIQPCILHGYLALLEPVVADELWAEAQDTREQTPESLLARAVEIMDEATARTEEIVAMTRARLLQA
jgi:hypothetical protein